MTFDADLSEFWDESGPDDGQFLWLRNLEEGDVTVFHSQVKGFDIVRREGVRGRQMEPLGSVQAWCEANNVPFEPSPDRSMGRIAPETDDQKFWTRMRWH